MAYTQKILEEMVRDFCSVTPNIKSEVRRRISESIQQAIAEERVRVVGLVKREYLRGRIDCFHDMNMTSYKLYELEERYKQYLKGNPTLLSSLDTKPKE